MIDQFIDDDELVTVGEHCCENEPHLRPKALDDIVSKLVEIKTRLKNKRLLHRSGTSVIESDENGSSQVTCAGLDVMENSTLDFSSEPGNLTLNSTDGSVVVFSLLFSLSALTVAMNALILRAFHIEGKLRTYSNQYILNITIADLLVGYMMAIRSTVNLFGKWIFGDILGHFFLGIQNSILGVSVLGIIAIASDRYVATSFPILHFRRKKKRIAHLVNGLSWVVALFFWVPITTIWNMVEPFHTASKKGFLWVNYGRNFYSSIAVTIARFAIPIVIITVIYIKINFTVKASGSRSLWKRFNLKPMNEAEGDTNTQFQSETTNDISLTDPHDQSLDNDDGTRIDINASGVQNDDTVVNVHNQQGIVEVQQETDTKDSTSNQPNSICSCRPSKDNPRREDPETYSRQLHSRSDPSQKIQTRRVAGPPLAKDSRVKPSQLSTSNNNKVMRTLTLITVAFFLTWLPSSVAIIALDSKSKHASVTEFVRWASYSNSLINPITYAIAQPIVRQTIVRILRCR
ncbi:muscarinic acetylcholine receptor M2-like [Strongylocentrotus purpuratus]|uniref:G-protein coupled receptors family 1 profile domain-containing protein n=1 Tax=Strongylocentrotus purpuratus TaxID=7668 RepID=A0A7M7N881_STRPU|nr:muscarinic acetylcholine receptor M2-like [Strongylocentrotus purpuratus]